MINSDTFDRLQRNLLGAIHFWQIKKLVTEKELKELLVYYYDRSAADDTYQKLINPEVDLTRQDIVRISMVLGVPIRSILKSAYELLLLEQELRTEEEAERAIEELLDYVQYRLVRDPKFALKFNKFISDLKNKARKQK